MKSMTGFGVCRKSDDHNQIEASVRSVNGRFLEVRFHIPNELSEMESDIRKWLSQSFTRGSVQVFISKKSKLPQTTSAISAQPQLAKQYWKELQKLAKAVGLKPTDVTLDHLLRFPQVMTSEDKRDSNKEREHIIAAVKQAIKLCDQERIREGKVLAKNVIQLTKELRQIVEKIQQRVPKYQAEAKERLTKRWESLNVQDLDGRRFTDELSFVLDKADIQEELVRLHEHIQACHESISNNVVEGKKLDFYTQELLREVNTIGSKSQSSELTALVVSAKTLIEQMKEQVQNLE